MSYTKRTLKELNLLDDFLIESVTSYPRIGEEFSRELLQIIFNRKFGKLTVTPQKVYYGADTIYHGTRLDVYLEENEDELSGEAAAIFDVEPNQICDSVSIKSLPKRVRFYHAKIDSRSLKAGDSYNKLKRVIVVMITPFDPFGYNRMIYTVKNAIIELPEAEYEDGAMTLFLYTKGNNEGMAEDLQKLLTYMENSTEENATTEVLRRIHGMVETVRNDGEVSEKYMKVLEREEMLIEKGQQIEKENTEREKRRADAEAERAAKAEKELAELKAEYARLSAKA